MPKSNAPRLTSSRGTDLRSRNVARPTAKTNRTEHKKADSSRKRVPDSTQVYIYCINMV
jgi:hypothetical protein